MKESVKLRQQNLNGILLNICLINDSGLSKSEFNYVNEINKINDLPTLEPHELI